jgi:uncharacterized protein involved in response to NO
MTTAAARWRFAWLFAAPHRLAFSAGALLFGASGLWWAVAMLAQSQGIALRWAIPPTQAHGLVMTLGFMPLFFCGFLFTAGPRWLGHPPVDARRLLSPLLAMVAGWLVFLLGAHGPDAAFGQVFSGLGLLAVAIGWSQAARAFTRMLCASPAVDRTHARLIAAAALVGAVSLWSAAGGMLAGDAGVVRVATHAALWGFVGVVYATVAHRMIPFFTAAAVPRLDAWRPHWLLWSMVALFVVEAVFAVADGVWWPVPAWMRMLQAAVELPAGVALLALALRWGLVQSLSVRLLAMLHLGFVWLGLAVLLSGLSHALMAASADTQSLGVAPLHAYTIGFLGSTLLAMVTRVSCGHGGRTLTADDFIWRLFWVLQAAALVRVAAAILSAAGVPGTMSLIALAALGWCAVCVGWALRYGSWYGTPRADGRPG